VFVLGSYGEVVGSATCYRQQMVPFPEHELPFPIEYSVLAEIFLVVMECYRMIRRRLLFSKTRFLEFQCHAGSNPHRSCRDHDYDDCCRCRHDGHVCQEESSSNRRPKPALSDDIMDGSSSRRVSRDGDTNKSEDELTLFRWFCCCGSLP
jgi:hypothetical protein